MAQHPQSSHELAWAIPTLITNVCLNMFAQTMQFLYAKLIWLHSPKKHVNSWFCKMVSDSVQVYSAFSTPSYQLCSRVTNYAPSWQLCSNYASIIGEGLLPRHFFSRLLWGWDHCTLCGFIISSHTHSFTHSCLWFPFVVYKPHSEILFCFTLCVCVCVCVCAYFCVSICPLS